MSFSSMALSATSSASDDRPASLTSSSDLSIVRKKSKHSITGVALGLWVIGSFLMGANMLMTENNRFYMKFTIPNVLVMLLASIILYQGLQAQIWWMQLPWIFASVYMMHVHHIRDIILIYSRLRITVDVPNWSWAVWAAYFIVTCYNLQLIIKMFAIAVQQWYTMKLLRDLDEHIDRYEPCGDRYASSDYGRRRVLRDFHSSEQIPVIETPEIDFTDIDDEPAEPAPVNDAETEQRLFVDALNESRPSE